MMQKFFVFIALLLVSGVMASTSVAAGPYISGNLGMVSVNDSDMSDGIDTLTFSFDNGIGVTGAVGTALEDGGRFEVELGYRVNDIEGISLNGGPAVSLASAGVSGEASSLSIMGNGFYDFATEGKFVPFVGVGIGFSKVEVELDGVSEDDTVFAYQLALGGGYALTETLKLDLQYRFLEQVIRNFQA